MTAMAATDDSPTKPRTRARKAPAPRAPLTPETWIEAATAVLVDQGIDHVRVDTLAHRLGVTRGSFYWHFRDRDDLLQRVLQAWSQASTEQLTRRLATSRSDAREQLRDVISLPHRGRAAQRAARIELAIRAWARRDETARRALDRSDASRIDYHAEIFEALGFDAAEARQRGVMLYGIEVAESMLQRQGTPAQRQERAALVERLMLQPLQRPAK
ncbi:MAG: TetR/AcrR family transcriptional regulator [Burkholderiales bacterium]|nr:TetR/AcrR family transcriptional regulator [Burkholderiales bacterium]